MKTLLCVGILILGFMVLGCVENGEEDDPIIERCNGTVIEEWNWETEWWEPGFDCFDYQCQGAGVT